MWKQAIAGRPLGTSTLVGLDLDNLEGWRRNAKDPDHTCEDELGEAFLAEEDQERSGYGHREG